LRPDLDYFTVRHASNRNCRVTRNDNSIRHIARDDRASSDQGILSDRHPGTQDTAATDPGGAQDARRLSFERQRGPTITNSLVIHGNNTRAAKYLIFNNYAARKIATTLQRNKIADAHLSLDVEIRTYDATLTDHGLVANEYEVADASSLTNQGIVGYDAVSSVNCGH
jgi:hypothetical protein